MRNKLDSFDAVTKIITKAIDFIFVSNPRKTSLGILFGIIVYGILEVIFTITKLGFSVPLYLCIAGGMFVFNINNIFSKHRIDEDLETQMYYLKEAQKNGNFTPTEKRHQWREYVQIVFSKVNNIDTSKIENSSNNKDDKKTIVK